MEDITTARTEEEKEEERAVGDSGYSRSSLVADFDATFTRVRAAFATVCVEAEAARQRLTGAEMEAGAASAAAERARQLAEEMRQALEVEAAAAANPEADPGARSALEGVAGKMSEAVAAQAARVEAAAAEERAAQAALERARAAVQGATARLCELVAPLEAASVHMQQAPLALTATRTVMAGPPAGSKQT
ncbi:hypothetical protein HYH02_010113 [Chlamydomonas schloesseri]|uniref:Uncharacterized protein n=1 Tax=Chlamydomonas schloesseri TaxID=2026947 RepID=A0A835TC06_9CHLO|nr:hypothetical protein HYH02_010113 [Chlamydomonas schloesseri]|eukprot:KAG2441271.1 hypothetical protein HYH02_010113 [Chlamydomonas schloesseri]